MMKLVKIGVCLFVALQLSGCLLTKVVTVPMRGSAKVSVQV